MENINVYALRRQGFSHKTKDIVCQDFAVSDDSDPNRIILCLSDGHGSAKYFRSDRGSRFACEVAMDKLKSFVNDFDPKAMLEETPGFFACGTVKEDSRPQDGLAQVLRHLGGSIIYTWARKVIDDWTMNPPTQEEMRHLSDNDKSYYNEGDKFRRIPKAYGCTLEVAVRTPDYWFAMHLGDGKIVAAKSDGTLYEPVPWDKECFGTTTTSLCELEPDEFRFAFGTNFEDVSAMFLASDGTDDSFADFGELSSYYGVNVLSSIYNDGWDKFVERSPMLLDFLSKNRSGDDMSLSCWVDIDGLKEMMPKILTQDKNRITGQIRSYSEKLNKYEREIIEFQNKINEHVSVIEKGNVFSEMIAKIKKWLSSPAEGIFGDMTNEAVLVKKLGVRNVPSNDAVAGLQTVNNEKVRLGLEVKVREDYKEKCLKTIERLKQELDGIEQRLKSLVSSDEPSVEVVGDDSENEHLLSDDDEDTFMLEE